MDTSILTARINAWITASLQAQKFFADRDGVSLTAQDIQDAAVSVIGVDDPYDLLDREWSAAELIQRLEGVDFAAWRDFEEVLVEESLLPSGMPRRLDEETVKFRGEKWRIHAYDPDPFPSLPHAHNISEGITMDLRNGRLYRGRRLIDSIGARRLLEFRNRVKRIPLPPLDEDTAEGLNR